VLIHPETELDVEDVDPTVLEVVNARMEPIEVEPKPNTPFMLVLYNGKFAVTLTRATAFEQAKDALAGSWFAPGVRKLLIPASDWEDFKKRVPVKKGVKGRGFGYYFDENDPRHAA